MVWALGTNLYTKMDIGMSMNKKDRNALWELSLKLMSG
jgi:hypothetical protein